MASASAELTVAKAALTGALFRADPTSCSRSDIESILDLVNSTVTECSPFNVQRCKQWALSNLVSSSARVAPFCKYLVALSKSFGSDKDASVPTHGGRVPSARRRRLHLLYVLNDILYHVKYRNHDPGFAQKLEPALPALIRSAVSFKNCPKHIRKVEDLVALWEENQYFGQDCIKALKTAIETPAAEEHDREDARVKNTADNALAKAANTEPFVLPATHGDPSTPWYDLPAGNWLPVMEPNSTRPMNPSMIKPLVLAKGPAEKGLEDAVKKLLADVDRIYLKDTDYNNATHDIGQMGEVVEIDEITGQIIGGETYYGWSRTFCDKMKARRRKGVGSKDDERGRGRSRSTRSYSRSESRSRSGRHRHRSDLSSRSSSRPAFKRQRISKSPRSRSRSSERNRSRSSQDSRRRSYRADNRRSRSQSRSRSRSPSRSRSRGRENRRRSRSGSQSSKYEPRSPSYSPVRSRSKSRSRSQPVRHYEDNRPPMNTSSFSHGGHFPQQPPPPPPPMGYPNAPMPNFPGGFPVPFPPNFGGQWGVPPPPPPMGLAQQQPQPPFFPPSAGGIVPPPPPHFPGGWVPPPPQSQHGYPPQQPPPPPPPGHYQNNHYSHQGRGGNGGYRGNGRGGYGRGGGNKW